MLTAVALCVFFLWERVAGVPFDSLDTIFPPNLSMWRGVTTSMTRSSGRGILCLVLSTSIFFFGGVGLAFWSAAVKTWFDFAWICRGKGMEGGGDNQRGWRGSQSQKGIFSVLMFLLCVGGKCRWICSVSRECVSCFHCHQLAGSSTVPTARTHAYIHTKILKTCGVSGSLHLFCLMTCICDPVMWPSCAWFSAYRVKIMLCT